MEYKYYNQFNLSNELSQAISTIISKKENDDYVCKILTLTIPEHKGMIFHSPLTNEDICRPGYSALSGSQIREINEKYGRYIEGTIPEETYSFFVVMKDESYKKISKLSFKSREEINMALQLLSVFVQEYNGVPWSKIAGMRDRIGHGYGTIEMKRVYETATTDIVPLKDYCKEILNN